MACVQTMAPPRLGSPAGAGAAAGAVVGATAAGLVAAGAGAAAGGAVVGATAAGLVAAGAAVGGGGACAGAAGWGVALGIGAGPQAVTAASAAAPSAALPTRNRRLTTLELALPLAVDVMLCSCSFVPRATRETVPRLSQVFYNLFGTLAPVNWGEEGRWRIRGRACKRVGAPKSRCTTRWRGCCVFGSTMASGAPARSFPRCATWRPSSG